MMLFFKGFDGYRGCVSARPPAVGEVKGWVVQFMERLLDTPHLRTDPQAMFLKLGQPRPSLEEGRG